MFDFQRAYEFVNVLLSLTYPWDNHVKAQITEKVEQASLGI